MSEPPLYRSEYPFDSHHFSIGTDRLHYLDEGTDRDGSPILFVHGNPTWSFAWRYLIRDLKEAHRCLAVDHIGCGLSDKPADAAYTLRFHIDNLVEFIREQDLHQITLVAHDWGGAIGMGAAAKLPERFSRFVLMNTAAFRSTEIPLRIAVCRWPVFGPLGVRGLNLFSRAAMSMAVANRKSLTPAARDGYLAPYDSWAHRIAVQRFVEDIPLRPSHHSYDTLVEVEEGLSQFTNHPMLFPWGMRDWCFTPNFLREFRERFPQAEVEEYPDAGHFLFEDEPNRLAARLKRFLADNPIDDNEPTGVNPTAATTETGA